MRDNLRDPSEVLRSLLACAGSVNPNKVGTNYAANGRAIPLDEADALSLAPRFDRCTDVSEWMNPDVAQPGLSAWLCVRNAEISECSCAKDGTLQNVRCVNSPSFLQVSALAVRAPTGGQRLTLTALGTVANTGLHVRFAVYRLASPDIYKREGFNAAAEKLLENGVVTGKGALGVSGSVSDALAANDRVTIPLSELVKEGDVLLIVPVVVARDTGTDSDSVHFGRQADPKNGAPDFPNARHTENLGWFPQISLI